MASAISSQLLIALQLILLHIIVSCHAKINKMEYNYMPALNNFDNYYDCLSGKANESAYPAKYCMIIVEIQANNDSRVWQQIESLKASKFNFRHDYIYRGLCMERCKYLLGHKANDTKPFSELLINEQTKTFTKIFNTNLDRRMRQNYQKEIHECVNREYMEKYNLSTKTFVKYCIDPQQSKKIDIYFILTIFLIIAIGLISLLSTSYDIKLKSQSSLKPDNLNNYFKIAHTSKVNRYLTAFSLYRNWNRLVKPIQGDIGSDLSFLDGIRATVCLLIVVEHAFIVKYHFIENPEFIEDLWQQLIAKLFVHAMIWLEMFFILSGLLLYVKFEKSQYISPKSSFNDCVRTFTRLLLARYLRYLPSLIFVIILSANLGVYVNDTSTSRSFLEPNCFACRNSWWMNLLMFNNYYLENSCLIHTWYIAADFQLQVFFLIICIIMAKFPKLKVIILTSVAILAAAINFGVNYILKLDSIGLMLPPNSFRYFYLENIATAQHLYFSSYTNIHSFLLGIVCGFIYMKYLRQNPANKERWGKVLQNTPYVGWLAILGILYLGTTIIGHTETTVWTAAYVLLHRHVSHAIVAVTVILRGICKGGGFLANASLRFLSRISFQMYLWHLVIYMGLLINFIEPIRVNFLLISFIAAFLYVTSAIVAVLVALFVEYPLAEVIAIYDIEGKIKRSKTL